MILPCYLYVVLQYECKHHHLHCLYYQFYHPNNNGSLHNIPAGQTTNIKVHGIYDLYNRLTSGQIDQISGGRKADSQQYQCQSQQLQSGHNWANHQKTHNGEVSRSIRRNWRTYQGDLKLILENVFNIGPHSIIHPAVNGSMSGHVTIAVKTWL